MPKLPDLHHTKTRLLISGFVVAASAVVAGSTHGVEKGGLVAVLMMALERIFGLTEHVLGHDLHGTLEERHLKPDDILKNHDLLRLVAAAIELSCLRIGRTQKGLAKTSRKSIELIGAAAPKHFQHILNERNSQFGALTESQVSTMLGVWVRRPAGEAILPSSGWEDLLCALAAKIHVSIEDSPEPSTVQRIMQALHLRRRPQNIERGSIAKVSRAIDPVFQAAMREMLKQDFERSGKGYAGLELSVWGELLVECQAIRQGLSGSAAQAQEILSLLKRQQVESGQIEESRLIVERSIGKAVDTMDLAARERHGETLRWLQSISAELGELSSIRPQLDNVIALLTPPDPVVGWRKYAQGVIENYHGLPDSYYPYAKVEHAVALRCQVNDQYTSALIPALQQESKASDGHFRPTLVLGEYGQGKSVACGVLAFELAHVFLDGPQNGVIPVLIPMRHLSGIDIVSEDGLFSLHGLYGPHLTREEFRAAQEQGKLFFILDGLDELIARHDEKDILFYLNRLLEAGVLRRNRFLVTTRPNVIERLAQETELAAHYDIFRIELISFLEALNYLRAHGLGDLLLHMEEGTASILQDLIKRPLFLHMIRATEDVLRNMRNLKDLTELDLFGIYVRQWHERERTKTGGILGGLTYAETEAILSRAGYQMTQAATDSITNDALDAVIETEVKTSLRTELQKLRSESKERLILVPEITPSGRMFTFRHGSLQSYFCAGFIYRSLRPSSGDLSNAKHLVTKARMDDLTLAFLLSHARREAPVGALLDSWYQKACHEPAYPADTFGAVMLVWVLRTGGKLDASSVCSFCARAEGDARRTFVSNLQNQELVDLDLSNIQLQEANLRGARIVRSKLAHANLRNAVVDRAVVIESSMSCTDLNGASFKRTDLSGVDLSGATGDKVCFEGATLSRAVLAGCDFHQADLSTAMLHEADLSGAHFSGSSFVSAEVHDANVRGAEFRSCDLAGAEFYGTDLASCTIMDSNTELALTNE